MDPDALDDLCSSSDSAAGESAAASDEFPRRPQSASRRVPFDGTTDPWMLDFGTIINPATPEGITQVYESALAASQSHPDDDYLSFRAKAADYVGCEAADIVPAAGGVAAFRLAVGTTVSSGDEVLLPSPSPPLFEREVRLQGGQPRFVPYDSLLERDPSAVSLVVASYPHNPTGVAYGAAQLREYATECRRTETPLLVDESLIGFTRLPSLAGEPGVIVIRSPARVFGLPGLRAGFLVATGRHRNRLDTSRLPCSISAPGTAVATYCLQQEDFLEETSKRVERERYRMRTRLESAFGVVPSDGPVLLVELETSDAVDEVLSMLRTADIAVYDARTLDGLDRQIRLTVRLPDENDRLLDALETHS